MMVVEEKCPRIAVIGAGVIGLSTALAIQEAIPAGKITIFTDKLLSETVSYVAAGIFHPNIPVSSREEDDKIRKWIQSSWMYFSHLAKSRDADAVGVHSVSGKHVSSVSLEACRINGQCQEFVENFRTMSKNDINEMFSSPEYSFGISFSTMVCDPKHYLRWMLNKVVSKCHLVLRFIPNIKTDDLLSDFDVVINCTGLGSRDAVGDPSMTPIRGQTIKVYAPWIREFTFADSAYIIPSGCPDGMVTLGGIKQFGASKLSVDPEDRKWIWDKCTKAVPSLKEAQIVSEWVGLRPFRSSIRVEKEVCPNGRVIIHNYGHGGDGIFLSRGTAEEAANLVVQHLSSTPRFSSTRSKL